MCQQKPTEKTDNVTYNEPTASDTPWGFNRTTENNTASVWDIVCGESGVTEFGVGPGVLQGVIQRTLHQGQECAGLDDDVHRIRVVPKFT